MALDVRLFEELAGIGSLRDAGTGEYLVPWIADAFPGMAWTVERFQEQNAGPRNVTYATLDSGVLTGHPLLADRIIASRDFTGEGIEDRIGHGTKVAVVAVLNAAMANLVVAKVYAADGADRATKLDRLVRGIRWAAHHRPTVLGLSIGISQACPGDHLLCDAVAACLDVGIRVVVAAEARCPAQCDDRIHVIGAYDSLKERVLPGAPPDWVIEFREHPAQVPMVPFSIWREHVGASSS